MIFSTLIWMLDIWVNSQLWWNEHVKKMLNKMKIQINMLIHITAFIWKVTLTTACHIYSAVIRSVLTHEVTVWHTDLNANESEMTHQNYKNKSIKKLVKIQNKCLQVIISTYKIILMIVLETETHIFLLNLYLNIRLASFYQWHKKSDMKKMIRKTCEKIWRCFCHDNVSRDSITDERQIQWVKSWQDQVSESEKKAEQQAMKCDWKKW